MAWWGPGSRTGVAAMFKAEEVADDATRGEPRRPSWRAYAIMAAVAIAVLAALVLIPFVSSH